MVDWRRPAPELCALVRALDFGARYPNTLGSPLVSVQGQAQVVARGVSLAGPEA